MPVGIFHLAALSTQFLSANTLADEPCLPIFSHFQTLSYAILFPAMDSAHNFGQIRLHVSRALFHLNHLASLIPFCVIDEDASDPPRWDLVAISFDGPK